MRKVGVATGTSFSFALIVVASMFIGIYGLHEEVATTGSEHDNPHDKYSELILASSILTT